MLTFNPKLSSTTNCISSNEFDQTALHIEVRYKFLYQSGTEQWTYQSNNSIFGFVLQLIINLKKNKRIYRCYNNSQESKKHQEVRNLCKNLEGLMTNQITETRQPNFIKRRKWPPSNKVAIKIMKEAWQPPDHNFMIGPPFHKLP